MERPCRIFSISHSGVVAAYRQRHVEVAAQGFELTLLTPQRWLQFNHLCETVPDPPSKGIEHLVRQPWSCGFGHHGLRNVMHVYGGLTDLLRARRPDVVELWEEPFAAVSWQAIRAYRSVVSDGIVVFFSAQNVPRWLPPPFSWFARYTYRHATACFAMNADVIPILRAGGWNGPTTVLPLGIDVARFERAAPCADLRVDGPSNALVVGFLGKLTEQKGILWLLAALERLDPARSNLFVLVIGSGELAAPVARRLDALRFPSRLVPSIAHDDVPAALATMDIVVIPSLTMPSLKEQFGRVAVEAMAAGKPVIVSNSGELPRVVDRAGIVVPEGDVDELARAITALVGSEELRRDLGEQGRLRAAEHFSWKTIASRQIDVYRRALDNRWPARSVARCATRPYDSG